jgi:glycosyltransferase involved in cell wall biosynthesis
VGDSRKMRIAFDIASLGCGGAERQVVEVAAGLCERRHDVLLIVNKRAEHYTEHLRRAQLRELHRTSRTDLRVVSDIRRALREFGAEVCVCVNFNASLWGRLAAASTGCRVVVAEHATSAQTSRAIRITNRALAGVTESVIACAEAQVDSLVRGGHPREKIAVVRNGVDAERFAYDAHGAANLRSELGVPSTAVVVALVAAHRPEKRQDRFISLLERLNDAGTETWGLMVGGGPRLEHTSTLARASRIAERLKVAGPRTDMSAVYSAADVVVLVSDDTETFPLCFLEAQACGVPVVGLDTGGVRETMIEGETGLVLGHGDLDGMSTAIAALLADPERRSKMGRAGREHVQRNLSPGAMIDGYERVLGAVPTCSSAGAVPLR